MTTEIPAEEVCAAIDRLASEMLSEARVVRPPVDAVSVAEALGLVVATDDRQSGRARFVRLEGDSMHRGSILVRPEDRSERIQWAVAHEIGESRVHLVYQELQIAAGEIAASNRERVANQLAKALLLPRTWFERDAYRHRWDLFRLKRIYSTASHELIARRMLDFEPSIIISIFDKGRVAARICNLPGRVPHVSTPERTAQESAHRSGKPHDSETEFGKLQAWPIHERGWKREILRMELGEFES